MDDDCMDAAVEVGFLAMFETSELPDEGGSCVFCSDNGFEGHSFGVLSVSGEKSDDPGGAIYWQ